MSALTLPTPPHYVLKRTLFVFACNFPHGSIRSARVLTDRVVHILQDSFAPRINLQRGLSSRAGVRVVRFGVRVGDRL